MIADVPQTRSEIQNSKMHWFTNNESLDQFNSGINNDRQRLSEGAIAGIIVGVLLVIIILLALLWRRFPRMRLIGSYIKNETIWQPRYICYQSAKNAIHNVYQQAWRATVGEGSSSFGSLYPAILVLGIRCLFHLQIYR